MSIYHYFSDNYPDLSISFNIFEYVRFYNPDSLVPLPCNNFFSLDFFFVVSPD